MSQITENTKKSGVKILCNILVIFGFAAPSAAWSATSDEDIAKLAAECRELQGNKADETGRQYTACSERLTALRNQQAKEREDVVRRCEAARKAVKDARNELSKKCGEASLGEQCKEEAEACTEAAGEDSYNSVGSFAEAAGFGQYSGALNTAFGNNKKQNGVCAKYNSKDYATEKKDIQNDLDKVAEDLAKLTEDKAKMQKDFAKEMQDVQKRVDEAQEELEKQKLKIKDSKRERLSSFQNSQNQQKEQLRQIGMSILDVKGKIISSERDKAMKLVALTEASGKRTCMAEYNKARANYTKTNSSSTSNFVASSSAKKNDLISIYTDCMAIFQQQRVALNESKKQEIDTLNTKLSDLQAQSDELTNTMELAANQLAEIEKDAATEQSQAEQKVMKLMQTSQQEMLTAQQELTSNLQALTQRETTLKTKQNRLNNSLMTMGPVPKSGAKSTPESIAREAGTLAENLEDAEKELADLGCSKGTSTRSSKSKSNSSRGNQ